MSYIDSRGVNMDDMSFTEALEIVHSLASQNQIDEHDVARGGDALAAQRVWQQEALDTLHDFAINHEDRLDELEASQKAVDWPEDVLRADRNLDASNPVNAIRICLSLAEAGALEPTSANSVDMADEIDRQQQALDIARDLLGMHGATLDFSLPKATA